MKYFFITTVTVSILSIVISGCSQSDGYSTSKLAPGGEVINGHTLPPEPDPAINNATLHGIDSNNNGVRDDVERKIYLDYDKEVIRQMLMQSARVNQQMLADPELVKNALQWVGEPKKKRIGCMRYMFNKYDIDLYQYSIEDDVYNTKERIRKYIQYNQALSGGVYWTENWYEVENSCDFNVTRAIAIDEEMD